MENNFNLKQFLKEGKLLKEDENILSKRTEKNEYNGRLQDFYEIELNNETYTTPNELNFQLQTIGFVFIEKDEELDLSNPLHHFYYIKTVIFDENGKEIETIPGEKLYGIYKLAPSLNKVKKWLNKRDTQLMSGKGFQHKST